MLCFESSISRLINHKNSVHMQTFILNIPAICSLTMQMSMYFVFPAISAPKA